MNKQTDQHRFDPEILRQLGRIDLVARTIAEGAQWGQNRSRRHGFSTEFSEFRPYAVGDDIRFVDWHVYARTDRMYVKCFEAETCLDVCLLLDATKSMAWQWRDTITKLEYGTNLLAALACLHMKQHDPVSLLVYDARDAHYLPPRCRRPHLDEMFAVLASLQPGRADALLYLINELGRRRRHRGRVIICSDLMENERELVTALTRLASTGDDCILIHILDRAEIELPFGGATHLQDSETGALLPVNIPTARAHHAERVRQFREKWQRHCAGCGIQYVPVSTDLNYVEVIRIMFDDRS